MSATPWRPSRPTTLLIGILSVWPVVYFFLFLGFIGYTFARIGPQSARSGMPPIFGYVLLAHLATILLMFVLVAVYLVHAFRTDRLTSEKRLLWVIVLIFFGMFAFPVYWYLYMWRDEAMDPATALPAQRA